MANPSVFVEFIANTQKLAAGVKDLQKTGEQASKGWDWKRVAKWSGAAVAVGGAAAYVKSAVGATEDLAKSTLALSRTTGLDTKTASQWAEVLKSRNIETKAFQMSMVKLSKLMETSRVKQAAAAQAARDYNEAAARLGPAIAKGGDAGKEATKELNKWGNAADSATKAADKANMPFEQLGISLADVRKGDTQKVLLQAADGFKRIQNPATRAALAQQLFSRQGQALAPILYKGSKAIEEQLGIAHKYGAELDGKTGKSVAELIAQQREMGIAMDGVKIKVGTALMPVILQLSTAFIEVVRVLQPLLTSATALKIIIGVVAVAFVAYKVAVIAAAVAENIFNATLSVTQILITAGIVVAIVALIAVIVLLIKHWDDVSKVAGQVWDAIKKGAQVALDWLKRNWPYIVGALTGPFGLAVAAIIKNWGAIKGAIADGINAVKSYISGSAAMIEGWGKSIGGWVKSGVVAALSGIGVAAWGVVDNIGAVIVQYAQTIIGWGEKIGHGIKSGFASAISGLADLFKAAINSVLRLWNALTIPGFTKKVLGHKIGFPAIKLPNIPLLAQGGIVTAPTLAMLGDRGPEAVIPLAQGGGPIEVRVFIGETELRGLVKQEVRTENNRTAQTLLAGAF